MAELPAPRRAYPRAVIFLFLAFALYLVIPLVDVPLLGLSLSAPLFFLVTLAALARPPERWVGKYRRWISLAALMWLGVTLSSLLNGLESGGQDFGSNEALSILRYAYWLVVFAVTAYFASRNRLGGRTALWLAAGVTLLALTRWAEVILFDRIGAGSSEWITQNSYGFLFSTFSVYILLPLFEARGMRRLLALGAALLLWGAVLVNGSRGSWIGVSLGALVFILLYLISAARRTRALLGLLLLSLLAFTAFLALPEEINQAVNERGATFDQLEEDKSIAIREVMTQKGWRLFQTSPWIGVGIGRFRYESTDLDIPKQLSYASQQELDRKSAHNSYIALLAETGLAGTLPFALLLGTLGLGGLRAALRLRRRDGELWGLAAYASFLGMSIHMWSISTLTNTSPWFVYGLIGALIMCAEESKTP